jgi:peptide/nickel transport system substrate-binding protein
MPTPFTSRFEQLVNNMDGLVSNSAPVNQVTGASLTKVGLKGDVEADLATPWSPNADGSVWTFTLRPNLKFSDASPLTADDVVFS